MASSKRTQLHLELLNDRIVPSAAFFGHNNMPGANVPNFGFFEQSGWNAGPFVPEAAFFGPKGGNFPGFLSSFEWQQFGKGPEGGNQGGFGHCGGQSSGQGSQTEGTISGSVVVAGTSPAEGISGVTVDLQGTTSTGTAVSLSATTDTNGNFSFANVAAGTYSIVEELPQFEIVVAETVGTVNGTANGTMDMANAQFTNITLAAGQSATGYVFGDGTQG